MASSDVVVCGSPLKVKQTLKRHTSCEDLLKEFNDDEKLCSTSASDSSPSCTSRAKICVCAPTKHAGSFRCRLHRAPPRPSHKQSVKTNIVEKPSRLSKMVKDPQASKDTTESSSPVVAD